MFICMNFTITIVIIEENQGEEMHIEKIHNTLTGISPKLDVSAI